MTALYVEPIMHIFQSRQRRVMSASALRTTFWCLGNYYSCAACRCPRTQCNQAWAISDLPQELLPCYISCKLHPVIRTRRR